MPENSGYMIAAYVVTAVVYLGYAGHLIAQTRRVLGGRED